MWCAKDTSRESAKTTRHVDYFNSLYKDCLHSNVKTTHPNNITITRLGQPAPSIVTNMTIGFYLQILIFFC